MISASPSSPFLRDGQPLPGAFGGNLARVTCNALSTRTGHFLFVSEQFEKLAAQIGNAGRVSPPGSPASGAAGGRGSTHPPRLPSIKVNHVAHVFVSLSETKFTAECVA